jgi:geranylgeranyl diphosphate synthase type I
MENIEEILSVGRGVNPFILDLISKKADPEFTPILRHQIESGGKRVRSALTFLCCMATGGKSGDALVPAAIFELVHNYSLIVDDIIDRGDFRRGSPTIRKAFSDAMALLAAMFYRETLDEMAQAASPAEEIRSLMRETIKELIEGERLDILFEQSGRDAPYIKDHRKKQVSMEYYLDMIGKKTAALIRASCLAGGYASKSSQRSLDALENFGWKLGLAFQVMDDYLDIFGKKTGKERGKDIREHKLGNIVIIHALQELDEESKRALLNILSGNKVSDSDLEKALEIIERTGSKEKTLDFAIKLVEEGKNSLEPLPESDAKNKLQTIADFIYKRLY